MKKLPMLLAVAMMMSAPAMAEPQTPAPGGSPNKIFFGDNKGKEVLSEQDIQAQKMEAQTSALQAMLEELKKTNEALTKQNELLQQQVDNSQKEVIALLKGFDAIMAKYNGKPAQ